MSLYKSTKQNARDIKVRGPVELERGHFSMAASASIHWRLLRLYDLDQGVAKVALV